MRRRFFLVVIGLLVGAMVMPAWHFFRPSGMNGPLSPLGVELKMLPNDNTNTMLLQVDMPAGTALAATDRVAPEVGKVLAQHRHVADFQTFLGIPAPLDFAALVRGDMIKRGSNLAQIRVNLIDKHHRSDASHDIANQLDHLLQPLRARHPQAKIKIYETPPGAAGSLPDPGPALRPGLRPAACRSGGDQRGLRADLRPHQRRQLRHRRPGGIRVRVDAEKAMLAKSVESVKKFRGRD